MTGATLRSPVTLTGRDVQSLPAAFRSVLERLPAESCSHFGVDAVRLEPVSYQERPFSHVLRVAVFTSAASRPATHLFVKVFKASAVDVPRMGQRVARDFETTSRIHHTLSRWNDLGGVRPIACYPEHLATVTEEAAGQTLAAYLQAGARWRPSQHQIVGLSKTMERVGRWVRAFQTSAPPRGQMTVDQLRSYVDLRLARLVDLPAAGFGAEDRRRVLAHIDRLGGAVEAIDLAEVPIHADLAPGNVLVSPDRVTVLDFAMSSVGSRLHDVARLFLQVNLMALKPQFSRAVLGRLTVSLLGGFDPGLNARRPMFRLLLLQHRINHLATLSTTREAFPTSIYNWHVRRDHRGWIASELGRSERGD